MPEFNPSLAQNDAIYASAIGAGEVAWGLAPVSGDSIWATDATTSTVAKMDDQGSVITSFSSPSDYPAGVGVNSNESLWVVERTNGSSAASTNVGSIYQMTNGGSVISSFGVSFGFGAGWGAGVDANDSIWVKNFYGEGDATKRYADTGSLETYTVMGQLQTGVGVVSDTSLWIADTGGSPTATVYPIPIAQATGSFSIPSNALGLGVDSQNSIWVSGGNNPSIYKYTTGGSQVAAVSTELAQPTGLGTTKHV